MHRRKDFYGEDAEEFRPERWIDGEEGKGLRVGWEYLPFNGGPRICIGRELVFGNSLPSLTRFSRSSFLVYPHFIIVSSVAWLTDLFIEQFALTEVSYVTVRLMQEFAEIESRDPEPWREKFTIVCTGLGGCKVVLTP